MNLLKIISYNIFISNLTEIICIKFLYHCIVYKINKNKYMISSKLNRKFYMVELNTKELVDYYDSENNWDYRCY